MHAVVVGSLVVDVAFHTPRMPQGGGDIVIAERYGVYFGGKGYNQAVALARLGAQVTLIAAVGDDDWGVALRESLEAEGVDLSRVRTIRGERSGAAVPLITPDGDVSFVHYPGANLHLSEAHVRDLPPCDVLMLQGEVHTVTSAAAAQAALRQDTPPLIFLNTAPVQRMTPDLLRVASVICANELEARELATASAATADIDLPQRLRADGQGQTAIVTLGARGAAWADGSGHGVQAPPRVHAVDATGAGDSFCAATAFRLLEGASVAEAVRFGCAAGAHAATVEGAAPGLPRRSDIERLLATLPS